MSRNPKTAKQYDFESDYRKWGEYARRFHEGSAANLDLYARSQSLVEKVAHRHVAEANANRRRILEIGGGGGEHIAFEPPIEPDHYVVIDLEKPYLDMIRKRHDVTVMAADGQALPFREGSFSSVISTSVFEHVIHLEHMLLEIKRVLAPGGDLLVVVPTNGSPVIEIYKFFISYPFMFLHGIKRPGHIWNYVNVNSFRRVRALLKIHFTTMEERAIPFRILPSYLSPLYFFHCRNSE